jgi:ATP-dependent helicase/nuclease subunit A
MRAAEITPEQSRAIYSRCPNICVSAAAGSGKTGVLARRYVRIIAETLAEQGESSNPFSRILVITFTDKAAREMRARIASELHRSGLGALDQQLSDAYISTIHSFCARLLREYPLESDLSPGFGILSDAEAARLLRSSTMALLDRALLAGTDNAGVTGLIASVLRGARGSGLDALTGLAMEAERLLKAARGGGVSIAAMHALLQRKGRSESLTPGSQLQPLLKNLQSSASASGAEEVYIAASRAENLLRHRPLSESLEGAAVMLNGPFYGPMPEPLSEMLSSVKQALSSAYWELENEQQSRSACLKMLAFTASVDSEYESARRIADALDTEDLQLRCAEMLASSAAMRAHCSERFQHILVDEFQDTDPLQARIIDMLHPGLLEQQSQKKDANVSQNSLFIVGDVRQSIYGFRGADPGIFQRIQRLFKQAGAPYEFIELADNFRSRPEILTFASMVFDASQSTALPAPARMISGRDFDALDSTPVIDLLLSQDLSRQQYASSEARALAAHIHALITRQRVAITATSDTQYGRPAMWKDVMVLFRSLGDAEIWRHAFISHGIPVLMPPAARAPLRSPEIEDLLRALTLIAYPHDDTALLAALRSPFASLSLHSLTVILSKTAQIPGNAATALESCLHDKLLTEPDYTACAGFVEALHFCQQDRNSVMPAVLVERFLRLSGYEAKLNRLPEGAAMAENVRRFAEFVTTEYSEVSDFVSLLGILQELRSLDEVEINSEDTGDAEGVRFLTIHGAKGLEAPIVAVADLSRSLLSPGSFLFEANLQTMEIGSKITCTADDTYRHISECKMAETREEMKRLLYVAMTRARERLILCGNLGRNRGFNWADLVCSALGIAPDTPDGPISLQEGRLQVQRIPFGSDSTAN